MTPGERMIVLDIRRHWMRLRRVIQHLVALAPAGPAWRRTTHPRRSRETARARNAPAGMRIRPDHQAPVM